MICGWFFSNMIKKMKIVLKQLFQSLHAHARQWIVGLDEMLDKAVKRVQHSKKIRFWSGSTLMYLNAAWCNMGGQTRAKFHPKCY